MKVSPQRGFAPGFAGRPGGVKRGRVREVKEGSSRESRKAADPEARLAGENHVSDTPEPSPRRVVPPESPTPTEKEAIAHQVAHCPPSRDSSDCLGPIFRPAASVGWHLPSVSPLWRAGR